MKLRHSRLPVLCAFVLASALAAQAPSRAPSFADAPLARSEVPAVHVTDPRHVRSALDRFVLVAAAEHGLELAPEATRAEWLRRAALDLTGLPPSPEEISLFERDDRTDAFEREVDRLLATTAHAERMTQWWLDLVRYADSQGYEKDALRPHAWRYRDWVIDAFAADLPFDRFTIEQLAGDLLPDATDEQRVATAMHRNTMTNTEGGTDDEEFRSAAVVDRVNTTMTVWMGATAGCAQCHDHKYDPISQREYFQLYAFFDQTEDTDRPDEAPLLRAPTKTQRARLDELDRAIAVAQREGTDEGEAGASARERLAALQRDREAIAVPSVPVLKDLPPDRRRTTHVHLRGSFLSPGDVVTPDVPRCWPPLPKDASRDRLAFARWLVDAQNPRTARVLASRLFELLFGRGLVATSEDFGSQGERPSHPELLDFLACELRDDGWSIRRFLRRVVLSATYRRSSAASPIARERDPRNVWLARGPRQRLSAEMLRDQVLAVSGLLARTVGGPSVMPEQPQGIWAQIYSGEQWRTSEGEGRHRRSLYTFWRRTSPHPTMTTFDAPSREFCVVRRIATNTPLQSLVLWNDPQFVECRDALARRVLAEAATDEARIEQLFRRCLARTPTALESERLLRFLAEERRAATDEVAFARVVGVVFALDEFLTH